MAKKKPDPEPAKPSKPAAKAEAKPTAAAPKPAAAKTVAPAVKSAPAPTPAPAPAPVVKVVLKPSKEEISKRAFEIWVAKGKPHGKDLENWQQAEKELGA